MPCFKSRDPRNQHRRRGILVARAAAFLLLSSVRSAILADVAPTELVLCLWEEVLQGCRTDGAGKERGFSTRHRTREGEPFSSRRTIETRRLSTARCALFPLLQRAHGERVR